MGMFFDLVRQYRAGTRLQHEQQRIQKQREKSAQPAQESCTEQALRRIASTSTALWRATCGLGRSAANKGVDVAKTQKAQVLIVLLCVLVGLTQWSLGNVLLRGNIPLVVAPESRLKTLISSETAATNDPLKGMQGRRGSERVLVGDALEWNEAFRELDSEKIQQWNQVLEECIAQQVCIKQEKTFNAVLKTWREGPVGWKAESLDQRFLKDHRIDFTVSPNRGKLQLSLVGLVLILMVYLVIAAGLCKAWATMRSSQAQGRALYLIVAWRTIKVAAVQLFWVCAFDEFVIGSCQGTAKWAAGAVLFIFALAGQWILAGWMFIKNKSSIDEESLVAVEARIAQGVPIVERRQLENSIHRWPWAKSRQPKRVAAARRL